MTSIDYTFEQVTAAQRIDWPLTDSPSSLAAYHDVSYQLLTSFNETGPHVYDVRYFYTNTNANVGSQLFAQEKLLGPGAGTLNESSSDTATAVDFQAAKAQLLAELKDLDPATGYLSSMRDEIGTGSTPILEAMFGVANDISMDQAKAGSATVNANLSDSLNLAAGIVSIGAAAGFVFPPLGIALGVLSGALWTGSAALSGSGDIPGPENYYDVTLTALAADAQTYATKALSGFDGAVDNIYSDWGKLRNAGEHTLDSSAAGWTIGDPADLDPLGAILVAGATRSLWFEVLPSLIGIRFLPPWTSDDPRSYGTVEDSFPPDYTCDSVYQQVGVSLPPASVAAYFLGDSGSTPVYQVLILAEGIAPQNDRTPGATDTGVSSDLANLLTTKVNSYQAEQPGLNIPKDILFNSGPLPSTPAATQFKTLCVSKTGDGDALGGAENSFVITGPGSRVVGQRVGSYVITPTDQDGMLNRKFDGKVAVELTGPGNTRAQTNLSFHGRPETVGFRLAYTAQGVYTLKVTSGSLDVTKQITVE